MALSGLEAVAGYALGTLQTLLIHWWKGVLLHRRQLTLIRAELIRINHFDTRFGWSNGEIPQEIDWPVVPRATDLFAKTVGEVDWKLTDEYRDDNSQLALLQLLDALALIQSFESKVEVALKDFDNLPEEEQGLRKKRALSFARQYDGKLDFALFIVEDAIRDMDRRIALTPFADQLWRTLDDLPPPNNPLPVRTDDDPRLNAWRDKRGITKR